MVYEEFDHRDATLEARNVQGRVSTGGLRIYRCEDAQQVLRDLRPAVTSCKVQRLEAVLALQAHAVPAHVRLNEG